jgi:two-component system response regulator AtoC
MAVEVQQSFRVDQADLPDEAVIFGVTPAMQKVRGQIECVLHTDFPVLLKGERGTGKELVARFLHSRSSRSDGPFVKVNCAAFAAGLLESELVGCEKRSSAGANDIKRGLVEIASGGTLFLDEFSEMDLSLQSKLLNLLQDGRYTRIGGCEERHANVRIVCSANIDLAAAVNKGAFRRDLLERMDVVCLHLPALRERKEDIPQLWEFFTQKLAGKFGKNAPQLTPAILHVLKQWRWPGNLCELENCIARVIILGDEEAMGEELRRQAAFASAVDGRPARSWHSKGVSRQAEVEAVILDVLQANHWNRRKTAEELKRSYRLLLYRLRNAGVLKRPRSDRGSPRS